MNDFKQKLISDIRVKLSEEFDKKFERKAFFDSGDPSADTTTRKVRC